MAGLLTIGRGGRRGGGHKYFILNLGVEIFFQCDWGGRKKKIVHHMKI